MNNCSSCDTCPAPYSTVTLPNQVKCWNVTVNFVSNCLGVCNTDYTYDNGGITSAFLGIDYQVDCNKKDSTILGSNCDNSQGIPSTFTSFCQASRLNVTPYLESSNGVRYNFREPSVHYSTGTNARLYQPPTGWSGPCLLVNLVQSTNQVCCQQIWNVYFQSLPPAAPNVTCSDLGNGNVLIQVCQDTKCPVPCDATGNVNYVVEYNCLSNTTANIICDPWTSSTSPPTTFSISANCSVTLSGASGPGCANITIGCLGASGQSGENTGNINICPGNCCIAQVKACNPVSGCCTPYVGPILFDV